MTDKKPGHELTAQERAERHNRHEAYAEVVADMFTRGESYAAISRATGIPWSTVKHMCNRLAGDYVRERYGDHTAILGRELNVLDQLTRTNLARAKQGDGVAAKIVLDSHIRRSKLLGLEAAVKAELTVKTTTDIEIERLIAMMGSSDPESVSAPGGSLDPVEGPESPGEAQTASESEGSG